MPDEIAARLPCACRGLSLEHVHLERLDLEPVTDTRPAMRPAPLIPLFANAKSLTGIGPRIELLLKKALRLPPGVSEPRVMDMLWHTPTGVIDRRATPTVASAVPGTIATLDVRVLKHRPSPRGNNRAPYKVLCEDETGPIDLVFFHAELSFIERQLPVGAERTISGLCRVLQRPGCR